MVDELTERDQVNEQGGLLRLFHLLLIFVAAAYEEPRKGKISHVCLQTVRNVLFILLDKVENKICQLRQYLTLHLKLLALLESYLISFIHDYEQMGEREVLRLVHLIYCVDNLLR